MGLDLEQPHQPGIETYNTRQKREGEIGYNGFGQMIEGPRSSFATREVENVGITKLEKEIELAKSIGILLPVYTFPRATDDHFQYKFDGIQRDFWSTRETFYKEFGRNIAHDAEFKALVATYKNAQATIDREVYNAKRVNPKLQEATTRRERSIEMLIAFVCKKFEDAGLNRDESYQSSVTPETCNLRPYPQTLFISI